MRTGRYFLFVGALLVVALFTNFGLFIAPAISRETPEQETHRLHTRMSVKVLARREPLARICSVS